MLKKFINTILFIWLIGWVPSVAAISIDISWEDKYLKSWKVSEEVNNCGEKEKRVKRITSGISTSEILQLEGNYSVSAEGNINIWGQNINANAEIQRSLARSFQRGISSEVEIELSAPPNEHKIFKVVHEQIWKKGVMKIDSSSWNPFSKSEKIPFEYCVSYKLSLQSPSQNKGCPNISPIGKETTIETHTVSIPSIFDFCPKHVRGDREFKGHGPRVTAEAKLYHDQSNLYVQIYLNAIETKKDWTQAEGSYVKVIFSAPYGYKIHRYSPTYSSLSYTDKGHGIDYRTPTSGDHLVKRFDVMGDRKGKDIRVRKDILGCNGKSVYMNVHFNSIVVEVAPF